MLTEAEHRQIGAMFSEKAINKSDGGIVPWDKCIFSRNDIDGVLQLWTTRDRLFGGNSGAACAADMLPNEKEAVDG